MEQLNQPRYEYRVFDSDLQTVADRLTKFANTAVTEHSNDIYIVSRLTVDSNIKLRDADLEIKVLEARDGVFELWAPIFRATFPVGADVFAEQVAPRLGIDVKLASERPLPIEDILKIVDDTQALGAIRVLKIRTKLTHEEGLSEFVELSIAGSITQSVAIEASELSAARRLLELAGVDTLPNTSYPALLQKLIFS